MARKLVAFIIIGVLSFTHAFAQSESDEPTPCNKMKSTPECDEGWVTLGFGQDSNELLNFYLRANFGRTYPVQVGFIESSSIFGSRQVSYLSVAQGASFVEQVGRYSIFVGPSFAWGDGSTPEIGIGSNAQIMLAPFSPIGLALDVNVNLSPTYSMVGFGFSLAIEGHK